MENKNFLMMGLPQSGKSTFVAALWHVVETGEIEESLTVTSFPEDRAYLNMLRQAWILCTPQERNKVENTNHITLNVIDNNTNQSANFSFPDVAGEMYKMQFDTRKISLNYANQLKATDGILLFIHPNDIKHPILISQANLPAEEGESSSYKNWSFSDVPTQVILVDLIQIVLDKIDKGFKIGVIISAWDLIKTAKGDTEYSSLKPKEWVQKMLPLLEQFLSTRSNLIETQYFGISAQGGKYPDDNSSLNSHFKQSERIIMNFDGDVSNDITIPLKWLLNN